MAEAATAASFDEEAVTAFQVVKLLSVLAALDKEDTSDLIWPKADILVLTVAALTCKLDKGCFSIATNCDTMDLTSSPLPMPVEEIVAIMNSCLVSLAELSAPMIAHSQR